MKHKLLILILAVLLLLVPLVQGAVTDNNEAWWCIENSTFTAFNPNFDCTTNGHNLTNNGGTFAEDATGGYYTLATNTYLDTNTDTNDLLGTTSYTFAFWADITANIDNQRFIWADDGNVRLENDPTELRYTHDGTINDIKLTFMSTTGWHHYAMVWTGTRLIWYIDGTETNNESYNYAIVDAIDLHIGDNDATRSFNGKIDELAFWNNTALATTQIETLYNGGTRYTPYPLPTGNNFVITAKDIWNSASINNFSAIVNGTTYHTTNGTITTTILDNATTSINITFFNSTYFNRTYSTYNVLASGNLEGELHQAELCLNATAKVSNSPLTGLTFYITGNSSSSCFNISAGTYEVTAEKSGWYNQTQNITINALQQLTTTIQNMSYANLTIYAIDGTTNESLSNYDLTITSTDYPAWSGETETAITNHSFNLINGTYEVSITMPGYAVNGTTANVTVNGPTNYTFTLYKSNSVRIYIKDEITNNPITENITIRWSSNTTTWENETNTGSLFIHNITPDEYELLFYGTNYSTRSYTITIGNQSTQELTAYMISSTYSTIFTIKDIDTATILDGVAITMYKQINSSWVTVESKVTDISGKAQFYYDPIAHYRFFLSNTNYDDYVFYLNPILFSTYDVFMVRSDLLNYSVDFENIGFIYSPTIFYNNQNETFTFLISSPEGLLTDYGIKLTYPGGTSTDSGVNAIGEQLTADVNITNATNYDVVVLEWNYTTSLSGTRTYTVNLPIITNSTPGTWLSNKDKTYGLGLFERLLIATIIIIFTVGIATMVGQVLPGVAIGLFLFGFLVFIGFIPLWAILPSMLVGILFLIWKSGGY